MPVHRPEPIRPRRLFLVGLLLTAFSLLHTAPAPAAESPEATAVPARGSAHMGMGVVAHDGQGGLPAGTRATQTEGVDVASYQGNVAWSTLWNSGVRWAYTKASEGTYYTNPYFSQQYTGSYGVGMIRGAYHFATPDTTSGATQADYFVDHGGAWSGDGRTLPGVLDIEWNPYGDACFGKTQSAMVTWIRDFLNRYKARTGRQAVIYTATTWWTQCTGNYGGFASTTPLWIARYASTPGTLPAGWSTYTMWQYTSTGPTVGDHDRFNGALDRVQALANG
ncbi:GH25 family lysozyme M1 (1,4-beta-N-acetylmuramidase) [Streptomyces sp. SAI-133]|uniref:lysozyme n=1 Tax=unclassified Streptomyces TaxID=2593676 RepID=UPI0024764DDB|nr:MULTISPECIES: lysozyme [unclassified Streptomyces]MDH6548760.1 GH25 family lysozyme M1 (1,4-beta-N-acetylmuramidase) [Streptomyces sp. SAI-041]MDH6587223.1 GH25 family lysozyme M1 (1,4-beta-N-acetylmuramidase) [Streptomyces sp. SAI-133]